MSSKKRSAKKKETTSRSKNSPPAPTTSDYYAALRDSLLGEAKVLSRVLQQNQGERGTNNEGVVRGFLERILPRRYALSTGFITASKPNVPETDRPISGQTDIIIYDELDNSPLFRQMPVCVLPIEAVYAAIEVKTTLRSNQLGDVINRLSQIRALAELKHYVEFKTQDVHGTAEVLMEERRLSLPPRCYVFAFGRNKQWTTIERLRAAVARKLDKVRTPETPKPFLHGLIVLEEDWFIWQEVSGKDRPPHVEAEEGDAIVRFAQCLLDDLGSFPMRMASMRRYLLPTDRRIIQGKSLHQLGDYVVQIDFDPKERKYVATVPDFSQIRVSAHKVSDTLEKTCNRIEWELDRLRKSGQEIPKPTRKLVVESTADDE